jgi:hypothetical protein
MKPGIMRTEDFPRRLHTAHGTSFSCNLSNSDDLGNVLYSPPYNTSLAYNHGLPLSGSFGKQR